MHCTGVERGIRLAGQHRTGGEPKTKGGSTGLCHVVVPASYRDVSVRPSAGESSGVSSGLDRRVQSTDRNLAIIALSFLWTCLNRDWWEG